MGKIGQKLQSIVSDNTVLQLCIEETVKVGDWLATQEPSGLRYKTDMQLRSSYIK